MGGAVIGGWASSCAFSMAAIFSPPGVTPLTHQLQLTATVPHRQQGIQ